MSWRVTITMDFDDEQTAREAMSDMEEAGAKRNGDLMESEAEDLDNLFEGSAAALKDWPTAVELG